MLIRSFVIATLLMGFGAAGQALGQTSSPTRLPPIEQGDSDNNRSYRGSPMEEMRARLAAKVADKEHRENLDRADELARLSAEVKSTFLASHSLTKDDQKKVEKIEKLVKKIRSEAGGSDGDISPIVPASLEDALTQIATISDDLNKKVSATPKQVVSAGVIEQTNQLIHLVRYVRGTNR